MILNHVLFIWKKTIRGIICDYYNINEKCFDKINKKDHARQKLTNSELAFISEDKYMSLQLMSKVLALVDGWMVIVLRM